MTQIGEASYTPPEPKVEDDKKKHVKLRFGIYNDGTLNNRTNINVRLTTVLQNEQNDQYKDIAILKRPTLTAEERKAAEELLKKMSPSDRKEATKAYQKHGAPPPSESQNSYEGYYSNVAKMEPHVVTDEIPASGDQPLTYRFSIYVEGVGTENKDGDEMAGYAFGTSFLLWRAGILQKVEKGVLDIVKKINAQLDKEKTKVVIDEIIIDVFGFSRGAAVARALIHTILFGDTSLKARLTDADYTVIKVKVCFAGLYDTVSTYASSLAAVAELLRGNANNVRELNLDAVGHAEESLHLTAADEHRFHFALTDIQSAGSKGREFALPGGHSDIGGGYRDASPEKQVLLGSTGIVADVLLQGSDATAQAIEQDKLQHIAAGWYREQEITVENHDHYVQAEGMDPLLVERRVLTVKRAAISNQYSKIPLHIMARYARGKGIEFKGKFDKAEEIPAELHAVRDQLDSYIASTTQSKASDWHDNDRPWLRKLRHDYLHFSARIEVGHDPRFRNGQRERYGYRG